jgi:hypothetical protein
MSRTLLRLILKWVIFTLVPCILILSKWVLGEQSRNIRAGLILSRTISMTGSIEHKTGFLVTVNYRMSGKFLCCCGK